MGVLRGRLPGALRNALRRELMYDGDGQLEAKLAEIANLGHTRVDTLMGAYTERPWSRKVREPAAAEAKPLGQWRITQAAAQQQQVRKKAASKNKAIAEETERMVLEGFMRPFTRYEADGTRLAGLWGEVEAQAVAIRAAHGLA